MMTLRCTRKLLKRLPAQPEARAGATSNALGDWYADVLFTRPQHLVMCTSERSLLPVVLPARELSTLLPRFRRALQKMLAHLSVSQHLIDSELAQMTQVAIAPTASRVVLGIMNDYKFQLRVHLDHDAGLSLEQLSLLLAQTPCGPLKYADPADAARQILGTA